MTTQTYDHTRPSMAVSPPAPPAPLGQAALTIVIGLALFCSLLTLVPFTYGLYYSGRILPGVSVGGVDLSGMKTAEAALFLPQSLDYPARGQVAFKEGSQVWVAHPAELGLSLDAYTTVQAAYLVGRTGSLSSRLTAQFNTWYYGVNLPPLVVLDESRAQSYLKGIASQVDRPILEATVSMNGVEVVVRPGQIGRSIDIPAALEILKPQLQSLSDGLINLVVHETPPVILDATQQAEVARRILSAPLVISVPNPQEGDPGPWTFDSTALAAMLTIERVDSPKGASYQVGLNPENLRVFMGQIAASFLRYPQDARFTFNDDTHQLDLIQHAVIGRSLDVEASLKQINDRLTAGEHSASLVLASTDPAVTDSATADSLGIHELVSSNTSYFYGSSPARIQNIKAASARFHGVLVPPGATFSMADVMGDVTLDNGYAEALIILGDRTIKGVGGGVCQVSTTLFRTVFFAGLPVVERHPHAYRVGYYEQRAGGGYDSNLAGLDATVFVPVVDFKFVNDSTSWLLMETYVNENARKLTWKFYSTSDGRKVDWTTTGAQNVVKAPDPLYELNTDLAQGQIKQVDWAADGADITVERTVTRNGQTLFTDTFATHYLPWQAVFDYGPGADIPTPVPTPSP